MADKIVLAGTLTYDSCLRLNGEPLSAMILSYMPTVPVLDSVHDFGLVEVEVTLEDYNECPHCGVVVRKGG